MHERLFEPLGMKNTMLPASPSNDIPKPESHGYLYGGASVALLSTPPYSAELQAAARAGKLLPKDYTNVNHSFAAAAGGVISNAEDLAVWIRSLVTGRVFNAGYQQRWRDGLLLEDPNNPEGARLRRGSIALS